jgi:hypothetical protein
MAIPAFSSEREVDDVGGGKQSISQAIL